MAAFILVIGLVLGLSACIGPTDAEKRFNDGVALLEAGRFEEAIATFDLALFLDGTLAVAFHNRALAKQQSGSLTSAIKDHTRSIELDPDLALTYAARGSV